jgi:hypothetical protein
MLEDAGAGPPSTFKAGKYQVGNEKEVEALPKELDGQLMYIEDPPSAEAKVYNDLLWSLVCRDPLHSLKRSPQTEPELCRFSRPPSLARSSSPSSRT